MEHSFNVEIAREYGIPAAILLKQISLWIKKNKREGRNQFEGKTWTYNSAADIANRVPYFSEYQVNRALSQMVQMGLITKGNFNKTARDRTTWYTLTDKAESLLSHFAESQNANCENAKSKLQNHKMDSANLQNGFCKSARPLPSKDTSINTSINTSITPPIIPPTGGAAQPEKPDTTAATRREILAYLNGKIGSHYRDGALAKKHINARLKEGYTLDDFKTVIDSKVSEWGGTDMAKYLRPETLFGTKFDGYLGSANVKTAGANGVKIDNEALFDEELEKIFGGLT